jgi:alpha-D-xyloside xylohydrolase
MKKIYALKNGENTLNISVCSDKIIHLTYGKDPFKKKESVVIVPEIEALPQVDVTYEENENEYVIKTGYVTVTVEKATFDIRFFNKKGELMSRVSGNELVEYDVYRVVGGQTRTRETVDGQRETLDGGESQYVRKSNHGKLRLCFSENEELFGLGSHEEGYDSLKGHFVPLYQENMRIALPYLVSTKGYAYLFDCYSLATFDATNPRYGKMWFECLEYLDYYFIAGEGFDDICRSYRALTGVTPMLPKWAVGYVQSKERYKTQDELIEVAGEYRRIGVPLDCIGQDWCTWTRGNW